MIRTVQAWTKKSNKLNQTFMESQMNLNLGISNFKNEIKYFFQALKHSTCSETIWIYRT